MENPSIRLIAYLVGVASIFIILAGIRGSAAIINPILLALVITITALPIPGRLTRRGLPGWLALVLTILVVVLLLGLVIMTIFFSITKLSTTLPTYMASAVVNANQDLPSFITGSSSTSSVPELSIHFGPLAQQIVLNVGNLLVQFGVALLIFFFMISAAIAMPGATRLGLNPDSPTLSRISTLTEDVRHYMTILTGINFLIGLGNTIFLLFLGVDYALLWGMLSWFMGYIPSIGFIIALIPPMLMAWAQYGTQTALIVLVGYVLINGGIQNFIEPKIMGQGLRISPVVVFIALFVWGFMLGGIGAILAVPLTLLVLVIMDNFEGTRTIATLFRYTGGEKSEERQAAAEQVKGIFSRLRDTFNPKRGGKDVQG